ncbi:MAG: helix-turn-helix domain-containing protein [Deltaproteobacteria bacterium]|nr:helix-turn-helix domain-containing protein [Deltaproteobacteria bacterium]
MKFDIFIRRVFEALKISSQNRLAILLGINRAGITQAKNKGTVPDKWILDLYRKYGINPDWIETGKGKMFIAERTGSVVVPEYKCVPHVKARLCAGDGSFEVDENICDYWMFRTDWLKSKGVTSDMILIDVYGNSMEPELKDGDTVLIDTSRKEILAGSIYAVGIDDTIMVKRIEKHPGKLVLMSDNKDYETIYLSISEMDSVRIIGKIVWISRDVR